MESTCIFCQIIANHVPSYTVYSDANTQAFLDTRPSAPGHTVVVHKKHGATLLDYSSKELGELFGTVQKVVRALETVFGTNACSIGMNYGEIGGIHHLHVHVIPRRPGDGGGVIQSLVRMKVTEKLDTIQEKIQQSIG